jgi:hypothetical protein
MIHETIDYEELIKLIETRYSEIIPKLKVSLKTFVKNFILYKYSVTLTDEEWFKVRGILRDLSQTFRDIDTREQIDNIKRILQDSYSGGIPNHLMTTL